jgi:hypothetical protein
MASVKVCSVLEFPWNHNSGHQERGRRETRPIRHQEVQVKGITESRDKEQDSKQHLPGKKMPRAKVSPGIGGLQSVPLGHHAKF